MTEDEAFKHLASEAFAGFRWTVPAADIPDLHTIENTLAKIINWWNGLDRDTRDIIGDLDLALGMWNKGWMNDWPALYTMMAGNPFGHFYNNFDNMRHCVINARDRAADYAAQHAVGKMSDDPAFQQGT